MEGRDSPAVLEKFPVAVSHAEDGKDFFSPLLKHISSDTAQGAAKNKGLSSSKTDNNNNLLPSSNVVCLTTATNIHSLGLEDGEIPESSAIKGNPKKNGELGEGSGEGSGSSEGFWLEANLLAEKFDSGHRSAICVDPVISFGGFFSGPPSSDDRSLFPEILAEAPSSKSVPALDLVVPNVAQPLLVAPEALVGDVAPPGASGTSPLLANIFGEPSRAKTPVGNPPEAPTFADLLSKGPTRESKIGTVDLSGSLPTAVFSLEECAEVSAIYKFALIGKFSFGKPDNFAIANFLFGAGFGKCKVQFLNFKHVLISTQNEDFYAKLWLKRELNVKGFPMRLFKWDPFFNFRQEPSLVPIWVKIFALPLQWFDERALQTIGSLMGTYLKADTLTINKSRLEFARICVEIDLKNNPPEAVGVSCGSVLNEYTVEYEKLPKFCVHCHHVGHDVDECYIKNPLLKPKTFTNKFQNTDNNLRKDKDKEEWIQVGKNKKMADQTVQVIERIPNPPPPVVANVCVENADYLSGDEIIVVDNRFSTLENMEEENVDPSSVPRVSNSARIGNISGGEKLSRKTSGKKRIDKNTEEVNRNSGKRKGSLEPEIHTSFFPFNCSPPPFVLNACNKAPICANSANKISLSGDDRGSSAPKTHSGNPVEQPINPYEHILSSSEDEMEHMEEKVDHGKSISEPSLNSPKSNKGKSGSVGDGPENEFTDLNRKIIIALPKNSGEKPFFLSVVYGKNNKIERRTLWEELTAVSQNHTPWMVGGDFNIVLYPQEKKGDNPPILSEMEEFRDAILECNLMDGGYVGSPFTWYSNAIWQRLDRIFFSSTWINKFQNCSVKHIPRHTSDHNSLLCTFSQEPFKRKSSFPEKEVVEAEQNFDTDPNISNKIKLNKANAELTLALSIEETFWKQKANVKWVMEGERNNKFFHDLIQDSAISHFSNLFANEPTDLDLFNHDILFDSIGDSVNDTLCARPSLDEVKNVVFGMDGDSVAGPDGFNAKFFQHCWDIIHLDVFEAERL
ncbi:hypothetical protein OROGR_033108 [Orobanche gracilis]